jgi:hypothetical protein
MSDMSENQVKKALQRMGAIFAEQALPALREQLGPGWDAFYDELRSVLGTLDTFPVELVVFNLRLLLDRYDVVRDALQTYISMAFPEIEGLVSMLVSPVEFGMMGEKRVDTRVEMEEAAEPAGERAPLRYANYEFYHIDEYGEPSQVGEYDALREDNRYELEVWIAAEAEGKPLGDEKGERRPIREPGIEKEATIYVLFDPDPDDFEFDESTQLQTLTLPPAGKGDSTRACFELRPRQESSSERTLAKVDVLFFYDFNLVESIEIRAEVVGKRADPPLSRLDLPEPIKGTYLKLGDWVHLDDVERREVTIYVKSLGNDRYQLRFLYGGLEYKGALRLTKQELEDVILRLREKLEYLAVNPQSPIQRKQSRRFKMYVREELAALGRDLWVKLFMSEKNKSLWHIGRFLREHPVKPGGVVQVVVGPDAAGFMFPWNLLYDGEWPVDKGAAPEDILEGFWGMRYCVEQFYRDKMGRRWRCRPVQLEQLVLGFMLHEKLPNADAQEQLMIDLTERSQHRVYVGEPVTKADSCFTLLKDCPSHILYFYSRGYTRRRQADMAYRSDMARGDMDEPRPERSYLLLSDRELYLDELDRSKDQINLRQKPIVVLNMCESAQVTPSLSEGFIPFFLEQGASAVVGTECPMTTSFGHPFAEALFYSLLRGDSLGEALLKARRKFLQPGEFMAPLGLAYTLYGPATLRYQPPLLMDPSAGVDGGRA